MENDLPNWRGKGPENTEGGDCRHFQKFLSHHIDLHSLAKQWGTQWSPLIDNKPLHCLWKSKTSPGIFIERVSRWSRSYLTYSQASGIQTGKSEVRCSHYKQAPLATTASQTDRPWHPVFLTWSELCLEAIHLAAVSALIWRWEME